MTEEIEVLEIEETKPEELTPVDFERLYFQQVEAMKAAEFSMEQVNKELNNQIEKYNRDFKYLNEYYGNFTKRVVAKEDAILEILGGLTKLIAIDKMNIAPERGETND